MARSKPQSLRKSSRIYTRQNIHIGTQVAHVLTLALGLLALAACGGGSGSGGGTAPITTPPGSANPGTPGSLPADPIPTLPPSPLPLQTEQDTDRMRTFLLGGTLHIGGEIDTGNFNAGSLETVNGVTRSFVTGVSVGETPDTLADYLHEDSREASPSFALNRHRTVPVVVREGGDLFPPGQMDLVTQALQIINESLPADFQLRYVRGVSPGTTPIFVRFAPREEWRDFSGDPIVVSDTALGVALILPTQRADIQLAFVQVDLERSGENGLNVLVHELIHALGRHHVPGRFNTLMTAGPRSNPGYQIYSLDTDALQAVYDGSLVRGRRYINADLILMDLGGWGQAADQLLGRIFPVGGGLVEFGAQLRNGHVRAFARGPEPQTDFVNNPASLGATYSGALSGFTYTGRPLQGTTRLDVDVALQHGNAVGDLLFRRLETFAPGSLSGPSTPYADGSLDYRIEVRGNTFRETSRPPGTEDRIDGAFFSRDHATMGGVLKRSDARAGFGGERR